MRCIYKWVQLVQGEIMLISITIILLFNFEKKNMSYVFLSLRTCKICFPSVFTIYVVLFYREKRRKNLATNFNKFCLHAVAGFATQCANPRCTREAKFEAVQRHYIKIYQSGFLLCYIKFIPFNICKNWG